MSSTRSSASPSELVALPAEAPRSRVTVGVIILAPLITCMGHVSPSVPRSTRHLRRSLRAGRSAPAAQPVAGTSAGSVRPRPFRLFEKAYRIEPMTMIEKTLITRSTSAIVVASVTGMP